MKHLRLIALVLAVSACFASLVIAGGRGKGAKASGTDECCGAKSATTAAGAANGGTCSMHGASTATASGTCTMHGTTAAAASGCPMGGKSAMAANGCKMHGTAAANGQCDMAGMASNCIVCTDEAACDAEMKGLGSHAQVVELRNGAMIVYTADTPENVRALQVALARHNEQVVNALGANSETNLCAGCKTFRGAMASGKFSRELVNVKNGAQVLLTSNDRVIVRRIHELAGTPSARIKT